MLVRYQTISVRLDMSFFHCVIDEEDRGHLRLPASIAMAKALDTTGKF